VGYRWRSYVEETRLCYKYSGYFFLEEFVSIYSFLCIVIPNFEFFKCLLAKYVAALFVTQCVCWTLGKLNNSYA
jgi:hypothetical protein